jgi:hypothetical protein
MQASSYKFANSACGVAIASVLCLERIFFVQDLISRLLERKPTRRLGMLNGRARDIKQHKWFDGLDWDALEARKMEPPRLPKDDSAKRLRELTVCSEHPRCNTQSPRASTSPTTTLSQHGFLSLHYVQVQWG